VVDRHKQAVRLRQCGEHVLENVLRVARIRDAAADEAVQPGLLARHHFRDSLVLVARHRLEAHRTVHEDVDETRRPIL
jgi:hypothetical protein